MRQFFILFAISVFLTLSPPQNVMADDDPHFSDYLSDEERKAFLDDEKNKLFNDGAVDLAAQEALMGQAIELQMQMEENAQEAEGEKPKVTYRYKKKPPEPEDLVPRLWRKPR